MKKLTFITAIAGIFIIPINSHAQGLYAGIGGGYGFPSQVQAFSPNSTTSGSTTSVTSQSFSLGSGVSVGVYGGYMVTKHLGFELGISEKFSSSTSSTSSGSVIDGSSTSTSSDVYTAKGSLFSLTPGIRLVVAGEGKLQVYTVTGLIIGFPSATFEDNGTSTVTSFGGSTTTTGDEIYTYSGGMIIGFHGAVGVVYMLSDKIGIFGEIAGNFQNWAPGEQLITTYTINGADQLSGLTTNEKQTNYESSYTSSSTSSSPGSPSESPKMYLPFSSWGITIGVHFDFGSGATAAATAK